MKRFWGAVLAVTAVVGALDMILHAWILKDLYLQTAALWRSDEAIRSLSGLLWLGYFVFSWVFVVIFTKGYEKEKSGLGQGLRYGFWVGLLVNAVFSLMCYVVMPIPLALAVLWFAGGMVECLVAGAIAGKIYRP